ncbi:thiamine phosphate synthase [Stomatohabitans albus]|uniref:thiamine phosphate synthase n=1 Tax=Stomatohabitans albus TaxID=3110766 RepID=UPI00300D0C69
MIDWSIYLVTDPDQCAQMGRSVPEVAGLAARAGARVVQVRAKALDGGAFLTQVLETAEAIAETDAILIVNDRIDVFLAARAALAGSSAHVDGVHIGQSDLPAEAVRALIGPDALLGLSTSTLAEVHAANQSPAGIDLQGIGPFRATPTKAEASYSIGVEGIRALTEAATTPTVAIGGVKATDVAALRGAGVSGVAVVSAICLAPDVTDATDALVRSWRTP